MGAKLTYPTVDLSDRVVVVTGANSGIGYATAKVIATMGAHTIIACRSRQRAQDAVEQMKREIASEHPDKTVKLEYMLVDLSSFHSVKDFTVAFRKKNLPLHVLINNAATVSVSRVITDDGYELQYQVNHLGPFLLTLELLPILLHTAQTCGDVRILFLSSSGHAFGSFDPNNMNGEHNFGVLDFQCHSKLYSVMTAYALQRRIKNVGVTVSAIDPGMVNTSQSSELANSSRFPTVAKVLAVPFYRNIYDGAATTLYCAVSPELKSQQCFYYSDCRVKQSSAASRNEFSQEQLWEISINAIKDFLSSDVLQSVCQSSLQKWVYENKSADQEISVSATNTADTNEGEMPQKPDTAEHWLIEL